MKEAGSLGVPVIVAAGYPWVAHALQIRSVAEQAEEATIIHGLPRLSRVFALLRTLLLIGLCQLIDMTL
jgi:hypothetical protein